MRINIHVDPGLGLTQCAATLSFHPTSDLGIRMLQRFTALGLRTLTTMDLEGLHHDLCLVACVCGCQPTSSVRCATRTTRYTIMYNLKIRFQIIMAVALGVTVLPGRRVNSKPQDLPASILPSASSALINEHGELLSRIARTGNQ